MIKFIFVFLFCLSFLLNNFLIAFTDSNGSTGNSITVWQDYSSLTGTTIKAVVQIGGVFSASSSISTGAVNPRAPIASINSSNQIVVVWIGNDPLLGSKAIYAASYPALLGGWGATTQISSALLEQVDDSEYSLKLSNTGVMYIEWKSMIILSSLIVRRASFSTILGTFGSPITIN